MKTKLSILFLLFLVSGHFSLLAQDTTEKKTYPVKASHETAKSGPCGGNKIFALVEDEPSFPGGDSAMMKFILDTIEYPEEAQKKKVKGIVYVSFNVCKDGSLDGVKILKGIGHGCDRAAKKAVMAMPKWEPGRQQGEPVAVNVKVPVRFKP